MLSASPTFPEFNQLAPEDQAARLLTSPRARLRFGEAIGRRDGHSRRAGGAAAMPGCRCLRRGYAGDLVSARIGSLEPRNVTRSMKRRATGTSPGHGAIKSYPATRRAAQYADMGFHFRRSARLFPDVRLNASKSGLSASFGIRGAWLTVGKRGTRATIGLPGTGISYSQRVDAPRQEHRSVSAWMWTIVWAIVLIAFVIWIVVKIDRL